MSLFFELLDKKLARIISVLHKNPDEHFHIQKLSTRSKVPLSSTFRIVNRLAKLGVIEILTVGKFKIYRLDKIRQKEIDMMIGDRR